MTDWVTIRKFAVGRHEPPDNWPNNVKPISQEGLALLGIDPVTNELFWDGQRLVTEKRWSNAERVIAWTGVVLAAIGVAATVVQAWAAVSPEASPTNFQTCLARMDDVVAPATTEQKIQALSVCLDIT